MRKLSLVILIVAACGAKKPAATTPAPEAATAPESKAPPCYDDFCGGPAGNVSAEPAPVTLPPFNKPAQPPCVDDVCGSKGKATSSDDSKPAEPPPPCDNPNGCV